MTTAFPCKKLLIPLDFSDDSRRALEYGMAVAAATGAAVALLTVVEDSFPYPELFAWDHPNEEFYKSMRERALHHMDELLQGAPALASGVEKLVVRGRPRHEIVAVAADIGVDLIVLARHGSSGIRHAFMGSTAESVLRHASCPVLVLPPSASAQEP
ncbi:MAG TPA: universal stress protein [Thermoanaerobaculia bacterium]|nr:universal stress protein [Thermoanaerobaculia bacterium]HXT52235.1 universal stress protein [Thermoanaerobaculia bacterium]